MQGHIRERGAGYQVAVYLGTDPVTKKPKYKYQTVQGGIKEAQKVLQEILHQVNTNTFVDPGRMTFGQYLDKWLADYCKNKLAPLTYHRYEEIIKLHIMPELGKVQLAKLKPLDLQNYYTKKLSKKKKAKLSPTTVLFHHRIIHKALEQAIKWQLIGRNVADAVEPPRKAEVEYSLINKEEIKKVLEIAKEKCPVALLPFYLASVTGMRRGEVLGLRWQDFDKETGILSVKNQVQRIDGVLTLRPVKTKKSKRPIRVNENIVAILEKHREEQKKIKKAAGKSYKDRGLVFCWEDGHPIDPNYITKKFLKITRSLGLSVRFHDLRHGFATMLLSNNVHAKIASETLGHSSIGITMDLYSHILPSMQEGIVNVVGENFADIFPADNEL